jgi:hypothetical protein
VRVSVGDTATQRLDVKYGAVGGLHEAASDYVEITGSVLEPAARQLGDGHAAPDLRGERESNAGVFATHGRHPSAVEYRSGDQAQ